MTLLDVGKGTELRGDLRGTRIGVAQEVQEKLRSGKLTEALAALPREVTHLVLPVADFPHELHADGLKTVYEDKHYRVYRLSRAAGVSGKGS